MRFQIYFLIGGVPPSRGGVPPLYVSISGTPFRSTEVTDIEGEALVVSQFTLAADTSRGNRPGFSYAAHPEKGEKLYNYFTRKLQETEISCKMGVFGGDMMVSLINDGPTTIWLDNKD